MFWGFCTVCGCVEGVTRVFCRCSRAAGHNRAFAYLKLIMYLVLIAWFYVTLMMAIAEATSAQGTVLGAIVTFTLYGLLPMAIVGYILGTPARKRAIRAREQAQAASAADPDAGGHAPAGAEDGAVAPVRKEP